MGGGWKQPLLFKKKEKERRHKRDEDIDLGRGESVTPSNSILERIKKLAAMAERGTEHEAALAGERMQALLQEYNLTLADVESTNTDPQVNEITREKKEHDRTALYVWQRDLMRMVAGNNFCLYLVATRTVKDVRGKLRRWNADNVVEYYKRAKCHTLIGRSENVTATIIMYDYLVAAMARLLPYAGKERHGTDARLWYAGCVDRICERLEKQRTGKETETQQRNNTPGLVRLSDLYGTEWDLNEDFRRGREPGTTARLKREEEAEEKKIEEETERLKAAGRCWEEVYYMARGWEVPDNVPRRVERETPEQETKRREQQKQRDKKYYTNRRKGRSSTGWTQKDQQEYDRKRHPAYSAGRRTGENIGLGGAIEKGKRGLIDA